MKKPIIVVSIVIIGIVFFAFTKALTKKALNTNDKPDPQYKEMYDACVSNIGKAYVLTQDEKEVVCDCVTQTILERGLLDPAVMNKDVERYKREAQAIRDSCIKEENPTSKRNR